MNRSEFDSIKWAVVIALLIVGGYSIILFFGISTIKTKPSRTICDTVQVQVHDTVLVPTLMTDVKWHTTDEDTTFYMGNSGYAVRTIRIRQRSEVDK